MNTSNSFDFKLYHLHLLMKKQLTEIMVYCSDYVLICVQLIGPGQDNATAEDCTRSRTGTTVETVAGLTTTTSSAATASHP